MEEESKVLQNEEPVQAQEPEEVKEQADEAKEDTFSYLEEQLGEIKQALDGLQRSFDDKIAEDKYKNGLFDNMHRELVNYQNGTMDKIVNSVAMDIIQLVDVTEKDVRVYEEAEPTEENYAKLLRKFEGVVQDLLDILYRQNIEPYCVDGEDVDVRRQKIIQTIPTDDESKDNKLAECVVDGYEKDGKVLRPQRIKIFKYEKPTETPVEE